MSTEHQLSEAIINTIPPIYICLCGFKGSEQTVKAHIESATSALAEHERLPSKLRNLAGIQYAASPDAPGIKLMTDAAEEIDRLRSKLAPCYRVLEGYSEGDPAEVLAKLIEKNGELLGVFDRVTAALGLARDTKPADVAAAVRMCTKRCQELEHKVLAFQEAHVNIEPARSSWHELDELRARIAALESKR